MISKQHKQDSLSQQQNSGTLPGGEKKDKGNKAGTESTRSKEKANDDYWSRIAEDPASGYKNEDNDDPLLNVDQQTDDNKRGDEVM